MNLLAEIKLQSLNLGFQGDILLLELDHVLHLLLVVLMAEQGAVLVGQFGHLNIRNGYNRLKLGLRFKKY